jgi:hypothetical protein
MYRITIHCEADSLTWIEPIARHLGHVEIAIDALEPPAPQRVHPAVEVIERTKEEQREIARAKARRADADRKDRERQRMSALSPRVIRAVACPTCNAAVGVPCGSEKTTFGMTGHTHLARRTAYADLKTANLS